MAIQRQRVLFSATLAIITLAVGFAIAYPGHLLAADPQAKEWTLKALSRVDTTEQESGATTVASADIQKPVIRYLGPLNSKYEPAFGEKLFPGKQAVFTVAFLATTSSDAPIDDLKLTFQFPDFATVASKNTSGTYWIGDGDTTSQKNAVVWNISAEDQRKDKGLIVRKIVLQLAPEVSFEYSDLNISAKASTQKLAVQRSSAEKVPLWVKITGTASVFDRTQTSDGQPLQGVPVRLYEVGDQKSVELVPDDDLHKHVVTDQEGNYTINFARGALSSAKDTTAHLSVGLEFQSLSKADTPSDGKPYGLALTSTKKALTTEETTESKPIQLYTATETFRGTAMLTRDIDVAGTSRFPGNVKLLPGVPGGAAPEYALDQALTAASVWKNVYGAMAFADEKLGISPDNKWDLDHPLPIYFHSGPDTNGGNRIILGADVWQRRYARSPQNAELHEFGHTVLYKLNIKSYSPNHRDVVYGDRPISNFDGVAKIPEFNPFDIQKPAYIYKAHFGWVNDSTAEAFHEGFASFWAMIADQAVNGQQDQTCEWCYHNVGGVPMQKDPLVSSIASLDYLQTLAKSRLARLKSGGSIEEFAITGFLKSYVVGAASNFARLTSNDIGWTKQSTGSVFSLFPYQSDPLPDPIKPGLSDSTVARMKKLIGWLKSDGAPSVHMDGVILGLTTLAGEDTSRDGKIAPKKAGVHTLALAYGFFADENCNFAYDPGEYIGGTGHYQGVDVRLEDVYQNHKIIQTTFGARPWRGTIPIPSGEYVDLKLNNSGDDLAAHPVPITVDINYAAPFSEFSYSYQTYSSGGQLPLMLPDSSYLTRAIIKIGEAKTPVAVIDSTDYYLALGGDAIPETIATISVDVAAPKAVTVPEWPKDLMVPASVSPLDYRSLMLTPGNTPTYSSLPIETTPKNSHPAVTSGGTQSTTAGDVVQLAINGFSAPQDVTIHYDGEQLGTQHILTHTATVAALIPDTATTGPHTLVVAGANNETASTKLTVHPTAATLATQRRQLINWLLLLLILLIVIVLIRFRQKRLAAAILLLGTLGLLNLSHARAETAMTNPFIGRIQDFVQLVSTPSGTYRLQDFSRFPENFFGHVETICFAQHLADIWTQKHPDELLQVNQLSRFDAKVLGNDSEPRNGYSIDVLSRSADQAGRYRVSASIGFRKEYDLKLAQDFADTLHKAWKDIAPERTDLKIFFNSTGVTAPTGIAGSRKSNFDWRIDLSPPSPVKVP